MVVGLLNSDAFKEEVELTIVGLTEFFSEFPLCSMMVIQGDSHKSIESFVSSKGVHYINISRPTLIESELCSIISLVTSCLHYQFVDVLNLKVTTFSTQFHQKLNLQASYTSNLRQSFETQNFDHSIHQLVLLRKLLEASEDVLSITLKRFYLTIENLLKTRAKIYPLSFVTSQSRDLLDFRTLSTVNVKFQNIVTPGFTKNSSATNDFILEGVSAIEAVRKNLDEKSYGKLFMWSSVRFFKSAMYYKQQEKFQVSCLILMRHLEEFIKGYLLISEFVEIDNGDILIGGERPKGVGSYISFIQDNCYINFPAKEAVIADTFSAIGVRNDLYLAHGHDDIAQSRFDFVYQRVLNLIRSLESTTPLKWYTYYKKYKDRVCGFDIECDLKNISKQYITLSDSLW